MKIVVLLSRVPYPLEKGDKLRAFNQLKELSKRHEIYLFALNEGALHPQAKSILSPFCKQIYILKLCKATIFFNLIKSLFQKIPFQCSYFFNKKHYKFINQEIDKIAPDVIYTQLIRTTEYVRHRKEKKILDYQDVFSKGMFRLMEKAPFYKAWIYRLEYRRLLRYEGDVFKDFDYKTIITQVDRALIHHPKAEQIVVVPNGVDTQYFEPQKVEKIYDIIFTGNMSYTPNVFACEYLVKEILPELLKYEPNIKIVLCGVNPSPRVCALKSKNVEITGWVNDIRSYYAQSKIFVAPMELGTGLQNKLLEAMAMQLPCITSPLASKPINAVHNSEIIVCNSVLGYVDAIIHLLHQPDFYNLVANNAYQFVKQNYNWTETTKILENLILETKNTF